VGGVSRPRHAAETHRRDHDIAADLSSSPNLKQRFEREARATSVWLRPLLLLVPHPPCR